MPKTLTVQEAQQQLTAATATVDQLKAKILDHGPGAVTAEELGTAALAVEHANLAVQHAIKTAEQTAEAERLGQLQQLKAQILDHVGDVDTALDAMRQIETAAALLIKSCTSRQQTISHATAAMRKAGVPRHIEGQADQHAGLAWSEAGMGRTDEVHVDGRRITSINPGLLIAAALQRGTRQAGRSPHHLAPALDLHAMHQDVAHDPETWLKARY
ncbi:hypothetical protein [Streptomyces asiaticus]|uniref:hypothetical protein n=1 Tax=Streptomyces asiaticus TaxID=114695 RepID=UPI003F66D189